MTKNIIILSVLLFLSCNQQPENIEKKFNSLKDLDYMDILSLKVDEQKNVYISKSWNDYCTYNFLRLSSNNTLEDIKKQFYRQYKDNWYLNKECAER